MEEWLGGWEVWLIWIFEEGRGEEEGFGSSCLDVCMRGLGRRCRSLAFAIAWDRASSVGVMYNMYWGLGYLSTPPTFCTTHAA